MALTNLQKTILDTIAYFEGTIGRSQNGYDLLFGGTKVMKNWGTNTTTIRHRCIFTTKFLTKEKIEAKGFTVCQDKTWKGKSSGGKTTTAAGRYQYIGSSWWEITTKAGLGSNAPMSKNNQNIAAALSVQNKGVTEEDLSKALDSLTNFKVVLEKLKKTWESFLLSLNGSYGITPDMGWQFYKATHEKYKNGGNTGTQSSFSTSGSKLFYLDKDGKTISEFGNNLISTNGDTNKFYFNKPNDPTNKIIYFWAGLEKVIARKTQWNQIPQKIKDNYYIIMAAGVGETSQNTISELKKVVEGFDNSIKVDNLQKVLMGYSAGGYSVFNNYSNTYKFVALMDPSLSSASNTENRTYSNNVAMIWGSSGMMSIPNGTGAWGQRYPTVEEAIKNGGGFSQKITGLDHGKAIQIWFEKYESNLLDAGSTSSQTNTNQGGGSNDCNYTPTGTNNGDAEVITLPNNTPPDDDTIYADTSSQQCPSVDGITDAGVEDAYSGGKKSRIRLCKVRDTNNKTGRVNVSLAQNLRNMMLKAEQDGVNLTIGSNFRTMQAQKDVAEANNCYRDANGKVTTQDKGVFKKKKQGGCTVATATPGYSRHQSGTAIDFGCNGKTICYPYDSAWCAKNGASKRPKEFKCFKWMVENANNFGYFNYKDEAWHWSADGK
jgi:muramidase (phage lysozyme)